MPTVPQVARLSLKKILFLIPMIMLAIGCHDYKADVEKLKAEKDAMAQSLEYKDSTITSFLNSFNEIENNLATIEKNHIQKVLHYTRGNKTEAARLLDIGLTTLYRKIEEYHLE